MNRMKITVATTTGVSEVEARSSCMTRFASVPAMAVPRARASTGNPRSDCPRNPSPPALSGCDATIRTFMRAIVRMQRIHRSRRQSQVSTSDMNSGWLTSSRHQPA